MKYINIKEFREFGYLQELNRQFLHPLGLALSVTIADDGTETLGPIWDDREDPEGIIFGENMIDLEKVAAVFTAFSEKMKSRTEKLGYVIQPPHEPKKVSEDLK